MSDQQQPAPQHPQPVVHVPISNTSQATAQATAVAAAQAPATPRRRKSLFAAYSWLALGWWGASHRVYLGRPFGGWLVLFWVGWWLSFAIPFGLLPSLSIPIALLLLDCIRIPRWVREHNVLVVEGTLRPSDVQALPAAPLRAVASTDLPSATALDDVRAPDLRTLLLRTAHQGDGRLTVTQGILETGKTFEEVEACLQDMVQAGYVDVDNDRR